jgi:hypothetical protein
MSDKGLFEAAIEALEDAIGMMKKWTAYGKEKKSCRAAIRVLEDYSRWQSLIEAAGGVDKARAIRVLATLLQRYVMGKGTIPELERDLEAGALREIRALLEAIPNGGK